MADVAFSERAQAELSEMYLFGYQHFGEQQANRYIDEIEDIFRLLADNPRMGRRADNLAEGVHRHEHGRHVILYEETSSGISIIAIIRAGSFARFRL